MEVERDGDWTTSGGQISLEIGTSVVIRRGLTIRRRRMGAENDKETGHTAG